MHTRKSATISIIKQKGIPNYEFTTNNQFVADKLQ